MGRVLCGFMRLDMAVWGRGDPYGSQGPSGINRCRFRIRFTLYVGQKGSKWLKMSLKCLKMYIKCLKMSIKGLKMTKMCVKCE